MAKSKNHTSHNNNAKDFKHGIEKPKKGKRSLRGMYRPFLKNLKFAKKYNDSKRVVEEKPVVQKKVVAKKTVAPKKK